MLNLLTSSACAIALSLLLLPGCGGGGATSINAGDSAVDGDAGQVAAPVAAPAVSLAEALDAALSAPARLASEQQYPASCDGSAYLVDAGAENCAPSGTSAVFTPDYNELAQPGFEDTAYAIYGLGLDGSFTDATLTLTWDGSAPSAGLAWLGLPDYTRDRWQWQQLNSMQVALTDAQQYADASGNVFAAVVLLGTAQRTLASIALDELTQPALTYPVVDTMQDACFNASAQITAPAPGSAFYGQDAQHSGNQASYTLSGDGLTVHDNVTGLDWTRSADLNGDGEILFDDELTYDEATAYPAQLSAENFGGYDDWRLPSIKELYSLIDFTGTDPSGYEGTDTSGLIPFIDDAYFHFAYGDTAAGERIIDAQYASSTLYVDEWMLEGPMLFGVNFADGRIKGYGLVMPGIGDKTFNVLCVRGNPDYGVNSFTDNGDGTVADSATGLMWQQADSGSGMLWEDALEYAETSTLGDYTDWRLPDAKELQSILDYARSPGTTASPALDPVFSATQITNEAGQLDYPCYWSSTTHLNWTATPGSAAAYVAFGRAMGYMMNNWVDVHGAGAQRSDPKTGDPEDYPFGHGPQGDAIRIYNYVRLVRGGGITE